MTGVQTCALPILISRLTSATLFMAGSGASRPRLHTAPEPAYDEWGSRPIIGRNRDDVAPDQLALLDDEHAEVGRHIAVLIEVELAGGPLVIDLLARGGVRIWINGDLVMDDRQSCPFVRSRKAWVPLVAGLPAAIRIDYVADPSGGLAVLRWSSPSLPVEVIPSSRLFPNLP